MSRGRTILIVFAALFVSSFAAAQNLVPNGSFDTTFRGWDPDSVPVGWSLRDAANSTRSGSAVIVNDLKNGGDGQGFSQCVAGLFVAGAKMEIGAKIAMPTKQLNTGFAAVGINWFTDLHCNNMYNKSGPRATLNTPTDTFQQQKQSFTVPDGVQSALVVAFVTRIQDNGSLSAYIDDIYVIPDGAPYAGAPMYIPTAAHNPGNNSTLWRTDLEAAGLPNSNVSFAVDMLKRDQANPNSQRATFSVNRNQTLRIPDIVGQTFGYEGPVALRIVPQGSSFSANSRTYNLTTTGTYGQFVPVLYEDQAILYRETGRLIQLVQDVSTATGYRTNIGFVSAVGFDIHIDIALYAANGTPLGSLGYDIGPYEFKQIDKIFTKIPAGSVVDGYALISSSTPDARFFAYTSVTDNATGDPMCIQVARF
jgi:hypothetical protein